MPAALAGPLERIRSAFSTVSLGQKVVIGLLAAGLLLIAAIRPAWRAARLDVLRAIANQ